MTSQLIFHEIYMPQLGRVCGIRVLLPRNYSKHKSRRFPVIYLQDGQNLFEAHTAAYKHWRLREFMEKQPLYRQAILVGIDHGGNERMQEYAPFKNGNKGGKGHAYLDFIQHTLKPFIDSEYRTWQHREATAIVGSSLGGLIAFYAALKFEHTFGKIGILSPSLWFNPKVLAMIENKEPKSQVYICASKTEMRSISQQMEKVYWSFKAADYSDEQIRIVLRDRGRHSETFWAKEFKPMYEWLFPRTAF